MEGDYWEIDEDGHLLLYDDDELFFEGDLDETSMEELRKVLEEDEE